MIDLAHPTNLRRHVRLRRESKSHYAGANSQRGEALRGSSRHDEPNCSCHRARWGSCSAFAAAADPRAINLPRHNHRKTHERKIVGQYLVPIKTFRLASCPTILNEPAKLRT